MSKFVEQGLFLHVIPLYTKLSLRCIIKYMIEKEVDILENLDFNKFDKILNEAKNNSLIAKENILGFYENYIYKEALKIHMPLIEIDDLVAVGTITVLDCIKKYDGSKGNFTGYVTMAIRNNFYYFIKKEKNLERDKSNIFYLEENSFEDDIIVSLEVNKLHKAFKVLSIEEYQVIGAVYFEGKSLSQYCRENNIKYSDGLKIKKEAIRKLQEELKQ